MTDATARIMSLGAGLIAPALILTYLGREEFYLLLIPFVYWCVDARLGIRVGIMLSLSAGLNDWLKLVFHTPRPYWTTPSIRVVSPEGTFAMPSGHAQNAVSIWGLLAASLGRPWGWLVMALYALAAGLSRLILGVHFLEDVLVGWLIGALLLAAFLRLEPTITRWLHQRGPTAMALAGLAASLILILLPALTLATLSAWELPAAWLANAGAIEPLSLRSAISTAGTLLGLALGVAWLHTRGGYTVAGPWSHRILRYLLGLVILLILWQGLGAVLPRDASLLAGVLRYARYVVLGLWVAAGAPLLFARLGLSGPRRPLPLPGR